MRLDWDFIPRVVCWLCSPWPTNAPMLEAPPTPLSRTDVPADADAAVAGAGAGVTAGTMQQQQQQATMKLHLVSGSFFTAEDGAGPRPAMDVEVWSRLPRDLMWEVLQFVPAASHFRLQLVSREWRQVLNSADFRNRAVAATAARDREQQRRRQRVVAAVCSKTGWSLRCNNLKVKAVDIDLSSFVPGWFWKPDSCSYSVVAAADGLVCISNHKDRKCREARANTYCVLNPLTRECKVLPQVPFKPAGWLPPTPTTLAIYGYRLDGRRRRIRPREDKVYVATYDLAASDTDSRRGWDVAVCQSEGRRGEAEVALCAGETFMLCNSRLHVLAPGRGPGGGGMVEVASLKEPSVALLGVDASASADYCRLEAHRGALFLVKRLARKHGVDVMVGVWRLARERLQWETVARLDVAELQRLTGLECTLKCDVTGACGAGEELWFILYVGRMLFWLGFNLDTGKWELVTHHTQGPQQQQQETVAIDWDCVSRPFELRPDLFM